MLREKCQKRIKSVKEKLICLEGGKGYLKVMKALSDLHINKGINRDGRVRRCSESLT